MSLVPKELLYDDDIGIYSSDFERAFSYSDGGESKLLSIISKAKDRSVFSTDLLSGISDWATYYHLSPYRSNIMRAIPLSENDSVLEIGGGCGAITRYVGETGAQVCSVEGSLSRAKCIKARCSDLDNVKVICDNVFDVNFKSKFDYITLIGVFEYTKKYSEFDAPYLESLNYYRSLLKPSGKIVIAIENRLGLKYFCGYNEDHLAKPYAGIENEYGDSGIETFGKVEISKLLQDAGFLYSQFMYPFPDYKFPKIIFTELGVVNSKFNPVGLAASAGAQSYTGPYRLLDFDYSKALNSVFSNGLLGDLSNSFLVIASADENIHEDEKALGTQYNYKRKTMFHTETSFALSGDDIVVRKTKLDCKTKNNGEWSGEIRQDIVEVTRFIPGEVLLDVYKRNEKERKILVHDYVQFVLAYFEKESGTRSYDLVPRNVIVDHSKNLNYIDDEWVYDNGLSSDFILFRGLYEFFKVTIPVNGSFVSFLNSHLKAFGVVFTKSMVEEMRALDNSIQQEIMNENRFVLHHFSKKRLKKYVKLILEATKKIYHRRLNV